MVIEIREERPDDVAAIRDVNKRAFDQDQEGNIDGGCFRLSEIPARILNRLIDSNGERLMSIELRGVITLLQVFDMPASVRFYRDILGFEIVQTTTPREGDQFDWGLLRLDNVEVMLNTAHEQDERPAQLDPARIAAHRDTHLYFGCPDVDAAYRHLQSHGIDVEQPQIAPWGAKQLYVRDPDGYQLCFQWRAE